MAITFPGESADYRKSREKLLQLEVDARRALEKAAKARRELPPGGLVASDYVFENLRGKVKLSELFGKNDTLVIYSYMFGPERDLPCNMCTPMLDGLDGVEEHIRQRASLVIVAESPAAKLAAWAKGRGWKRLRLISTAGNSYNRDYHGKNADGHDTTMINVFHRAGGEIRHFWGAEMIFAPSDPGQDHRGVDMINPVFAVFDLTPEGRGNWYTKLFY